MQIERSIAKMICSKIRVELQVELCRANRRHVLGVQLALFHDIIKEGPIEKPVEDYVMITQAKAIYGALG